MLKPVKTLGFFATMVSYMTKKFFFLIALIILIAMSVLMWLSVREDSATSDEPVHLLSGYVAWKYGNDYFDLEHPLLIKMASAVPLLFQNVKFDPNDPNYKNQDINFNVEKEFKASRNFLDYSGNNPDAILNSARIPMIFLTFLFGVLVFFFTKRYFGSLAALTATFLFATEPNILANGRLVDTDMAAAGFLLLSLFALLLYNERQSLFRLIFLTVSLAIGFLSKYSLLFFYPIVILSMEFIYRQQKDRPRSHMLFVTLGVGLLICLVYGLVSFRAKGLVGFFPLDFLKGLIMVQFQLIHDQRFSYLLGHGYYGSRWYYFPVVILTKTQLLTLGLFIVAIFLAVKKSFPLSNRNLVLITIPYLLFFSVALFSKLNIGVRHILPIYPLLIVGAAVSLTVILRWVWGNLSKPIAVAACGIIVLTVVGSRVWSVATTFPAYLSYYNISVGGTDNGWKISEDSNYDWGQDVKRLADYVNTNHIKAIAFDNYTGDFAAKDYYHLPVFPANPNNHNYKGYIALSTSVITYHQDRPDTYNWLVNNHQPIARAGKSIFIYKLE